MTHKVGEEKKRQRGRYGARPEGVKKEDRAVGVPSSSPLAQKRSDAEYTELDSHSSINPSNYIYDKTILQQQMLEDCATLQAALWPVGFMQTPRNSTAVANNAHEPAILRRGKVCPSSC